jgi:hypothetical protein
MKRETLSDFLGLAFIVLFIVIVASSTKDATAITIARQTKCWNTSYRNLVLNYTETLLKQRNLTNSIQNLTIVYCNNLLVKK